MTPNNETTNDELMPCWQYLKDIIEKAQAVGFEYLSKKEPQAAAQYLFGALDYCMMHINAHGRTTPPPSGDAVRLAVEALEQSILDLSYYIHLATKAKTNNKWIDCEIYKITMSLERLEKALSALRALPDNAEAQPHREAGGVDVLANFIRTIDGENTMGAGALAEKIIAYLSPTPAPDDEAHRALDALDKIFLTICPTMNMTTGVEQEQGRITLDQYTMIRAALTARAKG